MPALVQGSKGITVFIGDVGGAYSASAGCSFPYIWSGGIIVFVLGEVAI